MPLGLACNNRVQKRSFQMVLFEAHNGKDGRDLVVAASALGIWAKNPNGKDFRGWE